MSRHLEKRSVALAGHRTSVAVEPEFWVVLEGVATGRGEPLAALLTRIDAARGADQPLASALRTAALRLLQANATPLIGDAHE